MAPTPSEYIRFDGVPFVGKPAFPAVNVLCGDTPPTITDGYAIWQTIPRPLLRGLSIFQGYNPTVMTIDLRFGRWREKFGWDTRAQAGINVEADISGISWMAGEGITSGPSAVVYVSSIGNLIPSMWQGKKAAWTITGLTWGLSYRNSDANRVWQEATVTLTQYLSDYHKAPKDPAPARGSFFTTTPSIRTALAIVNADSKHSKITIRESLARRLIQAPQNAHLHLHSIRQKIKVGERVYVPPHVNA